jgi:group II intron reverse transcriptase/maturase
MATEPPQYSEDGKAVHMGKGGRSSGRHRKEEARAMRTTDTLLSVVRERGRRRLPLERVYRLLFNPELYLTAYGRIAKNAGAMTPGVTPETADGMSQEKIGEIIGLIREERYRFKPARRVYIEKKNSTKKRPLGIPTWGDKLVQEVVRLILEAYYEPRFSKCSHGFRAGRGCHTALNTIYRTWNGTTWFIEGDITGCFDNLDHGVLLNILREDIHDGRFIGLIKGLLDAGYMEEWVYHRTQSGSPQGGIVSPILANIYLDRLDQWVETTLIPEYTRGTQRKPNKAYARLAHTAARRRSRGRTEEAEALLKQMRRLPSQDFDDPGYRRLRYVRYADDFLLGFAGPKSEADEIKRRIGDFLRDHLKLEMSEEKTLITHGRSGTARFLGYELTVMHSDQRRAVNGVTGLKMPMDVVHERCAAYSSRGKPMHLTERTHDDVFSIIRRYEAEYRGVAEYYRMAYNLRNLNKLRWTMETSLTKTLAAKLRISVAQVYRRYQRTIDTERGPRKVLQTTVERPGKAPLVATWNRTPLVRDTNAVLRDDPSRVWNDNKTEIVQRLLAVTCELCGSREGVQVHHIRALKDLNRPGRPAKPGWMKRMAARRRKTLVVCLDCHNDIHAGRPTHTANTPPTTGEPDDAKASRPVWRGADGKGAA